MSAASVFLYVQHLLGIGHLKRAAVLARALAVQGLTVTLASGGPAVPGISSAGVRLVQLPPASAADLSFKVLLDETGRPVDEAWKRARSAALLEAWRAAAPRVLMLELYPFGRRQMRFELLPLLEAAQAASPRPSVVCSVRDILGGQRSRERHEETLRLVERFFDHVLVHGDPGVIGFETSFPDAARIAGRTAYTGYVVDAAPPAGAAGRGEVIVSAGGGAVGARLLEAALQARPLCHFRKLSAHANGVAVERSRPDFTTLLANCALSISQAGYNTLLETVQARARAVVVPFAGGNETEQSLRAHCFARRGLLEVLEEPALSASALAAAIDRAARAPQPSPGAIDLDGARKSAALVARWARQDAR